MRASLITDSELNAKRSVDLFVTTLVQILSKGIVRMRFISVCMCTSAFYCHFNF